jgi:hypothetical protein
MRGVVVVFVAAIAAGCGGPRWRAVSPRPEAVYQYDAPIERYADDDPGLWVVAARDPSPDGRRALAAALDDPDDVEADGFVVWATGERARWLRGHPAVGAVTPLQPAQRVAATAVAGTAPIRVRIELAGGATDAQRAGVIAWLGARGAAAAMAGPRTLDAELAPSLARELATLGPVRWIAPRAAMR